MIIIFVVFDSLHSVINCLVLSRIDISNYKFQIVIQYHELQIPSPDGSINLNSLKTQSNRASISVPGNHFV
uniref:Secreted peptide n=1 Tax=Anopheles braziliensis TaxID=58242 RepID=A0A2M3ZM61_9DIPT